MTDRCEYPRCRQPAHLRFLGHYFCYDHWSRDMKDINLVEVIDAIHKKTGRVPAVPRERPGEAAPGRAEAMLPEV